MSQECRNARKRGLRRYVDCVTWIAPFMAYLWRNASSALQTERFYATPNVRK